MISSIYTITFTGIITPVCITTKKKKIYSGSQSSADDGITLSNKHFTKSFMLCGHLNGYLLPNLVKLSKFLAIFNCQYLSRVFPAPTHPPSHLQVEAPDSRHIRVSWAQPPQSTWQCSDIQVELQATEPPDVSPVVLDGRQTTHIFDTEANQQWNIRIRSKNSAGDSPWSQLVSARSPPIGELIVGPTITYRHGVPVITWSSKERVEDLIRAYYIEYRTFSDPQWQRHRIQVMNVLFFYEVLFLFSDLRQFNTV